MQHLLSGFSRDAAFILAGVFLVALMFGVGLAPTPHEPRGRHEKRRLLVVAVVFDLIAVPALALLAVRAVGTSGVVASALLLLAAAPGGPGVPYFAKIARADVALSGEIALFLAKITVFTAPVVARRFLGVKSLSIRELPFLVMLVLLQLVPLYAGKLVRRWRARLAERMARPLELLVDAMVAALLALTLASGGLRSFALLGDRGWIAVLLLSAASLALGWLVGGPTPRTRRALALGANSRQLALALVMATAASRDHVVRLAVFGAWALSCAASWLYAWLVAASERKRRVFATTAP